MVQVSISDAGAHASVAPTDRIPASKAGVPGYLTAEQLMSSAQSHDVDSRAAVALADLPASQTYLRTAGYTTAGDGGGALYKRVATEPTHAAKVQSADGAWWEMVINGEVWIEQFGGKADWNGTTGTDNHAALMAATEVPLYTSTPNVIFGPTIRFRTGRGYFIGQTIELKRIVRLQGEGAGIDTPDGLATTLYFPANTTGIVTNSYDTLNGAITANTTTAAGSSFVGIRFRSAGGTDKTKHGFHMRMKSSIFNCVFDGFPGNGINIVAQATGPAATHGNANGWYIERTAVKSCGNHGLFVQYSDANVGVANAFQCISAAGCGIKESETLGNQYISPEIDGYGTNNLGRCSFGGFNYLLIKDTPGIGQTTTPGTNSFIWYPTGEPATNPAWSAATPYEISMPIFVGGGSARTVISAPYSEGGLSYAETPAIVIGGQSGWTRDTMQLRGVSSPGGRPLYCNTGVGGFNDLPTGHALGTYAYASVGSNMFGGVILEAVQQGNGGYRNQLKFEGKDLSFVINTDELRHWGVSLKNTLMNFGRSAPVEGVWHARWIALGDSTTNNYRIIHYANAAPSSGAHASGEIVFNIAPVAGGFIGWSCITAGTPGVWKTFGALSA